MTTTVSPTAAADIAAGLAAATAVAPALGPNAVLAVGAANILMAAIQAAIGTGADITDAQLAALFADDDMAKAQDAAAQAAVLASQAPPAVTPAAGKTS